MDDIAARAGGWQGRDLPAMVFESALITDTLLYWRPDLLTNDAPDTGSLPVISMQSSIAWGARE